MKPIRFLVLFAAFLIAPELTLAQTQPWNTNVTSWSHSGQCVGGGAPSTCVVLRFQVEHARVSSGPYTAIGTTTERTFTHVNVAAGTNCYRQRAISTDGASDPGNVACTTNTEPPPPPSIPVPPTNNRVVTAPVAALGGMSPVYSVTANNEVGTFYGLIAAGRECMKDYPVKPYRGLAFYRVPFNPRELWVAPPAGVNLAAACTRGAS